MRSETHYWVTTASWVDLEKRDCPAIVDRDTFARVQELMKERMPARIHPRRASSPFLLSGLTHCGYCGKALIGRYAKEGKFAYYVCGTIDKKGAVNFTPES